MRPTDRLPAIARSGPRMTWSRCSSRCAALRQEQAATRAMYTRWQQELHAAVPTARIVELPGANLYMFLSNEADIIRELRAFAAPL